MVLNSLEFVWVIFGAVNIYCTIIDLLHLLTIVGVDGVSFGILA